MHHEHSIFFAIFNRILTALLGEASAHRSWWTDGISIGGVKIAGVAPRGEDGHLQGWLPDHVCMALFVFLFCLVVFPILSRSFRKDRVEGSQNFLELFVDFIRDLIKENIPHHGEKYLPIAGAFFFFIALSNLCGVIFFLQPPTSSLNTTFALSITCFFFFNAAGIRAHGPIGYLKHFMGPMLALAPLMFLIEMIGNFARALSLSMRLFGNIYGEHSATSVFTSMVPIGIPLPMLALGVFGSLLQAYVFTLLTTIYLGGATAHEH